MHPFDNNHVTGTIKFQTLKLTYLLLINFLSTRRWRDGNWPHKSWSLIKLSRSLIFSRPVSLSSLLMYVVVGLPRLPSLPCVGGGWTGKRIGRNFLKIFLSGFWIQSEILTDFWILQCSALQIHLLFGPGFWTSRVIKIFLLGFWIQGENGTADLVYKIIIMDWQICINLFTPPLCRHTCYQLLCWRLKIALHALMFVIIFPSALNILYPVKTRVIESRVTILLTYLSF